MEIGIVGLGRMGGNIARRLMKHGHKTVVFDANPSSVKDLGGAGATGSGSLAELVAGLTETPRTVWVMLPSGKITGDTVAALTELLSEGDIIIDGGNSFYKDDIARAKPAAAKGIRYVDVGTSGGVWGLERGYCMMIGGDNDAVDHLDPIFATLAPGIGDIPRTPGRDGLDTRAEQG
jgi:6-phosphogluconate dehydrogenase